MGDGSSIESFAAGPRPESPLLQAPASRNASGIPELKHDLRREDVARPNESSLHRPNDERDLRHEEVADQNRDRGRNDRRRRRLTYAFGAAARPKTVVA